MDDNEFKFKFIYNYSNFISLINEGLIHTYPIKTTIKLLNRELGNLSIKAKIDKEDSTNTIFLKGYSNSFVGKDIKILIRIMTSCGYFPSIFEFFDESDKLIKSIIYKELKNSESFFKEFDKTVNDSFFTQITIESRFNKKIDINFNKLYHVTKSNKLDKILSIGLVAKSFNKKSFHEERIYLGFNQQITKNLAYQFEYKGEYALLEIDTHDLKLNLYEDPDFVGDGCYTQDNIPPKNIKVISKFVNN